MSFAAPNMTASGLISGAASWGLGTPAADFGSAPFSLEAWVMPEEAGATATILTQSDVFWFGVEQGVLTAGWSGHDGLIGVTPLAPNTWCYVAVTYDGTNLTLFVDGAQDAQVAAFSSPVPAGPCQAGSGDNDSPMDLWSLAVYDYARTSDEEAAAPWLDVTPTPGLVAFYDFSIAPPTETTGAGLNVVPNQGATAETIAPAVYLDGQSSVGLEDAPGVNGAYTLSVWAALDNTDLPQSLISSSCVEFAYDNGHLVAVHNQKDIVDAPVSVQPHDWHNFAVTYDGTTATIYFDGAKVGSGNLDPPAVPTPGWLVGAADLPTSKGAFLQGYVQWTSVWSRALAPEEVAWQQYREVGLDPGILFDVAMDQYPPVDVATSEFSVALGGSAVSQTQRIPVQSWSPPPEQLQPGAWHAMQSTPLPASAPSVGDLSFSLDPFGEDHHAALLAEVEPLLAQLPNGLQTQIRASYAAAAAAALQGARQNPAALGPHASWHVDGDEHVFVYHHPDGDIELERISAVGANECVMWWLSFLFELHSGVFKAFAFTLNGPALNEWLKAEILSDQPLMQELATLFLERLEDDKTLVPGFVLAVLKIYSWPKVKSLFWNVVLSAGWFALGRALAWLAGKVFVGNALAVTLFVKDLAITSVKLAVQFVGTAGPPPIQGYNQCCGHESQAAVVAAQ